jgi:hypothetical protein
VAVRNKVTAPAETVTELGGASPVCSTGCG